MNKRNVAILVLLSGLLVGLFVYFSSGEEKPSRHNWSRTLDLEKRGPYDLSLLYSTLKETFDGDFHEIDRGSSLKNALGSMNSEMEPGTYFFIGNDIYLSVEDIDLLADHVMRGGVAFISANSIPDGLFRKFPGLENKFVNSTYGDTATVKFEHKQLKRKKYLFANRVKDKTKSTFWQYLETHRSSGAEAQTQEAHSLYQQVILSVLDSVYSDFVYTRLGDGKLFIHTNPVFFSNLYLQGAAGREYLSAVLKHLPHRDLWLDWSSLYPKANASAGHTRRAVFSFFEQNPPLKYAWWIMVSGVLIFLFVGSRRKQRSIPVINNPENNALGLVDSLGYFYFTENKNALVFKREWQQFQNFLRLHLHINPEQADVALFDKIATKARVSKQTVEAVFEMHDKYRIFTELSGEELMLTNKTISKFYTEYYNKNGK